MTLLLAAAVSAVVSAGVAYLYERFTLERRLNETLAKAELEYDREVILKLDRVIQDHRSTFWNSNRSDEAKEAFAIGLAHEYRPLFRELSNRMARLMLERDLYWPATRLAYDWNDAGIHWRGEEPWFDLFDEDVQLLVEGLEELIGGADDPFRV
jgi:hypothetical protein